MINIPIPLDKTLTEMGWSIVGQHGNHSRGAEHYSSKLTDQDVRDIRSGAYGTIKSAAEKLGVHYQTAARIKRRESWAHIK